MGGESLYLGRHLRITLALAATGHSIIALEGFRQERP